MRIFTFISVLFLGFVGTAQTPDDFVFTVDMNNGSSYDFKVTGTGIVNVDWGDGTTDMFTDPADQNVSHNYSTSGIYTVIINNLLESFKFDRSDSLDIVQWGTTQWQTMHKAFEGCENLTISAIDSPDLSQLSDMSYMFANSTNFNSDISSWDVSSVSDMSRLFFRASTFNQPLHTWNTSNVTDMTSVFWQASNFNQPLDNWDVSNVNTMWYMFSSASVFNQPLNNWDVSNVTNMSHMFDSAVAFNQPLNNWDVLNVTDMSFMFSYTDSFNQPLFLWDVSNVQNMNFMFFRATQFNQNLSTWQFNSSINFNNFIPSSGIDTNNFDALLSRFVNLNLTNNTLNGFNLEYCDTISRSILVQRGWNIYNDVLSNNCPDNNVTGTILYDINNNGCDATDLPTNNLAVEISNGTDSFDVFTFNGNYTINLPDGSYTISPRIDNSLFAVTPANAQMLLLQMQQV